MFTPQFDLFHFVQLYNFPKQVFLGGNWKCAPSVFFQAVNSFCNFILVNELTAPRNVLQLLFPNVSIPVEVWKKENVMNLVTLPRHHSSCEDERFFFSQSQSVYGRPWFIHGFDTDCGVTSFLVFQHHARTLQQNNEKKYGTAFSPGFTTPGIITLLRSSKICSKSFLRNPRALWWALLRKPGTQGCTLVKMPCICEVPRQGPDSLIEGNYSL